MNPQLTARALRVLRALEGQSESMAAGKALDYERVGRDAGYMPRSVRRALLELRRRGLILRVSCTDFNDHGGRFAGYRYEFTGSPAERRVTQGGQDHEPNADAGWPSSNPDSMLGGQQSTYSSMYVHGDSPSVITPRDATDVRVSSASQLSPPEEAILRTTEPESFIASFNPNDLTPQDEANVASVERHLGSLVVTADGRRDLAVAIRFAMQGVASEVGRLGRSQSVRDRAGALIALIRRRRWHVAPFDADGRCRSCGTRFADDLWCVKCGAAVHPPVWGSEPLSTEERATIALRKVLLGGPADGEHVAYDASANAAYELAWRGSVYLYEPSPDYADALVCTGSIPERIVVRLA